MKTIFVSSTFKDMHLERDAIRDKITPMVNAAASAYGQQISFCDLRWGIDTETMSDEKASSAVLNVCLDEIDRCGSPMIVIIGERYGWIPPEISIKRLAERKRIVLDDLQTSVTALEIEYGALSGKEKLDKTFFYFRDIDTIDFSESTDEPVEYKQKLKDLKKRIIDLTNGRIKTYHLNNPENDITGINEFADLVTADLIEYFKPEWEKTVNQTDFERENNIHLNYASNKARSFNAKQELESEIISSLLEKETHVFIKGKCGVGKTALISKIVVDLKSIGAPVIPVFCGLTKTSSTANDILQYLIRYLTETYSLSSESNIKTYDEEDTRENWYLLKRLKELCRELRERAISLIIIFDGLNQLYGSEEENFESLDLNKISSKPWLNKNRETIEEDFYPDNIHFIVSYCGDLFSGSIRCYSLDEYSDKDINDVVNGVMKANGRFLSKSVIDVITDLSKNRSMLYTSLLMQRLFLMNINDFAEISKDGDGIHAISNRQISILKELPIDTFRLYLNIIREIGRRINSNVAEKVMLFIAFTNHGISEYDLSSLMGNEWKPLDFACFINYLSDLFIVRSDGRIDFSNEIIREGIRYVYNDESQEIHQKLSVYLEESSENNVSWADEYYYHSIYHDDPETLMRLVNQLSFSSQRRDDLNQLAMDYSDMIGYGNDEKLYRFTDTVISYNWPNVIQFYLGILIPALINGKRLSVLKYVFDKFSDYFVIQKETTNCLLFLQYLNLNYSYLLMVGKEDAIHNKFDEYSNCISDAQKVHFTCLEEERKRRIESEKREQVRKKAEESSNENEKNRLFLFKRSTRDFLGSSYDLELRILYFRDRLIEDANSIIESLEAHNTKTIQLKYPCCESFGDYHGWLLSEGTDSYTLRMKEIAFMMRVYERKQKEPPIFLDIKKPE